MSVSEALGQQSQIRAGLEQGIDQISENQTVTFTQYQKWTFEIDGYVFWIATTGTLTIKGSLHYATDRLQDEDQTVGSNHVILTSEQEITQFNAVDPQTMWIADWPTTDGGTLQVAFAMRGNYYNDADAWHYSGIAVYPALKAQIVQSAADLPEGPIVSNSLPIWLQFNDIAPAYPSYLVPDNIVPPYVAVHVEPEGTESLAAAPVIGPWPGTTVPGTGGSGIMTQGLEVITTEVGALIVTEGSDAADLHSLASWALMRDRVRLILYGFTNTMAVAYLANLYESAGDPDSSGFGLANSPQIRDSKRPQVELAALAQRKTIDVVANYYQGSADAILRRLILSAELSVINIVGGQPAFGNGAILIGPLTMTASGTVG